jgi:hypothetical protein
VLTPVHQSLGEVQDAFHIDQEASYIVTVRNPAESTRVDRTKYFPPYLLEKFEGARHEWVPLSTSDFLDHEGTCQYDTDPKLDSGIELCLLGAAKDVEHDLGSLGVDLKMMEQSGARPVLHKALMRDLQLSAKGKRIVPLKTGEWA